VHTACFQLISYRLLLSITCAFNYCFISLAIKFSWKWRKHSNSWRIYAASIHYAISISTWPR